ncbi:MAG: hypothetical protein PF541_08765 [Prolixibacteraceae bacterium]|nr:hypothetical protein [Prolixibacteraceae bacterium]
MLGKSFIVGYADGFVLGFENSQDAERVMSVLPKRFAIRAFKFRICDPVKIIVV